MGIAVRLHDGMTDFREDLHPRSGNGQFASKEGWPPEVTLGGISAVAPEDSPSISSLDEGDDFELGYGEAYRDDEQAARVLEWAKQNGITAVGTYEGFYHTADASGQQSDNEQFNFALTLRRPDGREFDIEYSMGAAHETAPTIVDVLQNTASDAAIYDEHTQDEFAQHFLGISEEERYDEYGDHGFCAQAMYEALQEEANDFKEFVGEDYDYIVYGTEREHVQ